MFFNDTYSKEITELLNSKNIHDDFVTIIYAPKKDGYAQAIKINQESILQGSLKIDERATDDKYLHFGGVYSSQCVVSFIAEKLPNNISFNVGDLFFIVYTADKDIQPDKDKEELPISCQSNNYFVGDCSYKDGIYNITALDAYSLADIDISSSLKYPISGTPSNILIYFLDKYRVATGLNFSYNIPSGEGITIYSGGSSAILPGVSQNLENAFAFSSDEVKTLRELLSILGELLGGYFICAPTSYYQTYNTYTRLAGDENINYLHSLFDSMGINIFQFVPFGYRIAKTNKGHNSTLFYPEILEKQVYSSTLNQDYSRPKNIIVTGENTEITSNGEKSPTDIAPLYSMQPYNSFLNDSLTEVSKQTVQTWIDEMQYNLNFCNLFRFRPYEIEFFGNPTIIPGDIIKYGGENILVGAISWTFRGKMTITGIGGDPSNSDSSAESKLAKSIEVSTNKTNQKIGNLGNQLNESVSSMQSQMGGMYSSLQNSISESESKNSQGISALNQKIEEIQSGLSSDMSQNTNDLNLRINEVKDIANKNTTSLNSIFGDPYNIQTIKNNVQSIKEWMPGVNYNIKEINQTISQDPAHIITKTTEEWENFTETTKLNYIYVYSDYDTEDLGKVTNIKIGDGKSKLSNLPFVVNMNYIRGAGVFRKDFFDQTKEFASYIQYLATEANRDHFTSVESNIKNAVALSVNGETLIFKNV